jgi:hypothetical protein
VRLVWVSPKKRFPILGGIYWLVLVELPISMALPIPLVDPRDRPTAAAVVLN